MMIAIDEQPEHRIVVQSVLPMKMPSLRSVSTDGEQSFIQRTDNINRIVCTNRTVDGRCAQFGVDIRRPRAYGMRCRVEDKEPVL